MPFLKGVGLKASASSPLAQTDKTATTQQSDAVQANPQAAPSLHNKTRFTPPSSPLRCLYRWEHFSLALCSIVELEHADAIAAVRTTSAADRFALLLSRLREALGEVRQPPAYVAQECSL